MSMFDFDEPEPIKQEIKPEAIKPLEPIVEKMKTVTVLNHTYEIVIE